MQNVHEGIIATLKSRTPEGENPVNILTELLQVSREGAYRRLRGEIQLTLEEAIIVAKKLDISIDNLIESNWEDNYVFHISPFTTNPRMEKYYQMLKDITDAYRYIMNDPNAYCDVAGKVLPPTFYFKYNEFTKYALFKWIYLFQNSTKYASFSNITIPSNVEQLTTSFIDAAMQVPTTYILNEFMFTTIAKDLDYFLTIKLLTKEDVEILKRQILLIIDDMEDIAARGAYKNGTKVSIYVTDAYFDISYNYLEGNDFKVCGIGAYGLNFLSCQDLRINENFKKWTKSLIKYSTAISLGGEIQRLAFFNKQREKIKL